MLAPVACLEEFAVWEKRAKALPTSHANAVRLQRLGRPRHTAEAMEFDGLNYDEFDVLASSLRAAVCYEVYGLTCVCLPGSICMYCCELAPPSSPQASKHDAVRLSHG